MDRSDIHAFLYQQPLLFKLNWELLTVTVHFHFQTLTQISPHPTLPPLPSSFEP